MNIAHYFINHCRAGQADYHAPRRRGTVTIKHDLQRWTYLQPRKADRAAFKRAVAEAFASRGGSARVAGRWPCYTVETSC